MAADALFSGDRILSLIPQRAPMLMLDTFFEGNETEAHTGLTVQADNLFCVDGRFTEPGLMEHIAQSASAHAGYKALCKQKTAPLGFIGEIKKFRVFRLPAVGEQLRTSVNVLSEVLNISLISAEITSDGEPVATCQMKIFIQNTEN
jgi:predicted hotdog family 3-hydroxylacyl-ACP dehydratase